jgi:hypothetical protein
MLLIVACSSALRASGTHGIESNNISPSGTEKQKAPNLSVRSLLFAADQNRTDDTGIFGPLLYRLSYSGITFAREGIYSKRPDYCQPECDKKLRHMLGKA